MAATDFIVAIELGSTKITGLVGKKNTDGSINVLAYAKEHSSDCIKKGVIYNLDKTTQKITSVIKELENHIQAGIKKVYVGIGGLSLRGIKNTVSRQFNDDTRISQAIIDSMMKENMDFALMDYEILDVEPQEYKIGNNLLTEPVGTNANNIDGNYLNIIARPSVKQNIKQCFLHSGYEIAGFVISPMATADTLLTNNEKRSGCALVDIGNDTTSVAIYKNNLLRHICVIPLGSNNITKDISSKHIEEEDAEQLKIKYASAYTEHKENEEPQESEFTVEGKYTIQARVLEDIVEARVNEILTNVFNQIKLSGYSDNLMAGIVITGGTSNMPNIDRAMNNITKFDKIRIAHTGDITNNGMAIPQNGTTNTLVGILLSGEENCCRIDPRKGHQLDFEEDKKNIQDVKEASEENKNQENIVKEEVIENVKVDEKEEEQEIIKISTPSLEEKTKECQELIRTATQHFLVRNYSSALEVLEKARLLNIESKTKEIESMEIEAKRLLDEAERVRVIKENRLAAEKQREKQRKEECDKILDEAIVCIDKGQYKEAQEKLNAAKEYNIVEENVIIEELEEKIKKSQKHKKGNIIVNLFKKVSDELFDGIK